MTLQTFFKQNPRAAIAFSGGVDSTYLLYAAKQYGCDIHAFFIKTAFQPEFELEDAIQLAKQIDVPLTVLRHDVFEHPAVVANPADRCYHCKTALFTLMKQAAKGKGYTLLIDGTNASDDCGDRPGMKALAELSVRSPLRECGITKAEIRTLSQKAGLATHNKPAYACLATRIPTGTAISEAVLKKVELAEGALFSMGFSNLRVRVMGDGRCAKLQLPAEQFEKAVRLHAEIQKELSPNFKDILLDLNPRG